MILVAIIFGCYFLGLLVIGYGWYLSTRTAQPTTVSPQPLTVLIAIRNEAQNLPLLIADLKQQEHPPHRVILVDDHSTDGSAALAEQLTQMDPRFLVTRLAQGQGKKQAIAHGVSLATTEWVCMTDADGRLPVTWLASMQSALHAQHALLIGPVFLSKPQSFFQRLQNMEWASLQAITFGTAGLGRPVMCNGANLAFAKAAFLRVGGYSGNDHIPSGDDEFLLRKIQQEDGRGISFCNDARATVFTAYQQSLSSFWQQRIRWASKWRHNPSALAKVMAVAVLVFQVTYLIAAVQALMGGKHAPILLACVGVKWAMEAMLLGAVTVHHRQRWSLMAFLTWQVVYPFYVLAVGVSSWFIRYEWKGRPQPQHR